MAERKLVGTYPDNIAILSKCSAVNITRMLLASCYLVVYIRHMVMKETGEGMVDSLELGQFGEEWTGIFSQGMKEQSID